MDDFFGGISRILEDAGDDGPGGENERSQVSQVDDDGASNSFIWTVLVADRVNKTPDHVGEAEDDGSDGGGEGNDEGEDELEDDHLEEVSLDALPIGHRSPLLQRQLLRKLTVSSIGVATARRFSGAECLAVLLVELRHEVSGESFAPDSRGEDESEDVVLQADGEDTDGSQVAEFGVVFVLVIRGLDDVHL